MSGVLQATFMNQRSFGPLIGEAFGGGFFAGQISLNGDGVPTHNLVVSPRSVGQPANGPFSMRQWVNTFSSGQGRVPGARSLINGLANTNAIITVQNNGGPMGASYFAASFCNNLVAGGFGDWYLGARYEMQVIYYNLKPTIANNATNWGQNPFSIPPRTTNNTTNDPPQTSAAAFVDGSFEAFRHEDSVGNIRRDYWASNERTVATSSSPGYSHATSVEFSNGSVSNYSNKSTSNGVRAVRRVPV